MSLLQHDWPLLVLFFLLVAATAVAYFMFSQPKDPLREARANRATPALALSAAPPPPPPKGARLILHRATLTSNKLVPRFLTRYLEPLLLVSDSDQSPGGWLAETILWTLGAAAFAFTLIVLLPLGLGRLNYSVSIPTWLAAYIPLVPLLRWGWLRKKASDIRNAVRDSMPHYFILAATVARVTNSIEGPGGFLNYMVNLVDSPTTTMFHKALIEAASSNISIEEVLEKYALLYNAPNLFRLAQAIRLDRRKGGSGLAPAIARISVQMGEEEIDSLAAKSAAKGQFALMVLVIFGIPGILLALLIPAGIRFASILGS